MLKIKGTLMSEPELSLTDLKRMEKLGAAKKLIEATLESIDASEHEGEVADFLKKLSRTPRFKTNLERMAYKHANVMIKVLEYAAGKPVEKAEYKNVLVVKFQGTDYVPPVIDSSVVDMEEVVGGKFEEVKKPEDLKTLGLAAALTKVTLKNKSGLL